MEYGRNKLQSTLALGEKTICHTDESGMEIINTQLNQYQDQHKSFCAIITDAIHDLEHKVQLWNHFDEEFKRLDKWLQETDKKIRAEVQPRTNIDKKKSSHEKLMVSRISQL